MNRHWLAGLLIGGWVIVTAGAFWFYEFRFLSPIERPAQATVLKEGDPVPALVLDPLSGSPSDLRKGPPTVLHFWNPACPCSRFNEPKVREIAKAHPEVRFVLVIEQAPLTPQLEKQVAETFPFPAVHDADARIAKAIGAYATPAACLIDGQGKVQYVGTYVATAYCSSQQNDNVKLALAAMLAGKDAPKATPAYGCAIPQN